jgi:TRAP-type C4-dicarboxylate transport system permease small subunit
MEIFGKILISLIGLAIFICALLVFKAGISRFKSPVRNEKLHLHGIPVPIPSHSRFNGFVFIVSGGLVMFLLLIIFLSVITHFK